MPIDVDILLKAIDGFRAHLSEIIQDKSLNFDNKTYGILLDLLTNDAYNIEKSLYAAQEQGPLYLVVEEYSCEPSTVYGIYNCKSKAMQFIENTPNLTYGKNAFIEERMLNWDHG